MFYGEGNTHNKTEENTSKKLGFMSGIIGGILEKSGIQYGSNEEEMKDKYFEAVGYIYAHTNIISMERIEKYKKENVFDINEMRTKFVVPDFSLEDIVSLKKMLNGEEDIENVQMQNNNIVVSDKIGTILSDILQEELSELASSSLGLILNSLKPDELKKIPYAYLAEILTKITQNDLDQFLKMISEEDKNRLKKELTNSGGFNGKIKEAVIDYYILKECIQKDDEKTMRNGSNLAYLKVEVPSRTANERMKGTGNLEKNNSSRKEDIAGEQEQKNDGHDVEDDEWEQ